VKCQCFKAKIENKTSVTTYFKKFTTINHCLKWLSYPAVFTSKVQCVRLAAGRHTLKLCCYRSRLVFSCCF